EFAGELTLLKSILLGIDKADGDFEEDIRLIEKLLYDNSSPRPPEEFVFANSDATTESFSPSPILVKDSDSLMEEIDLFYTSDYPIPSGIEDEDSDSERDILILKDLPSNNSLSFAEKESFHFDIPLFCRPLAKPPDGDTGILNIKMIGDISDQKVFMHKLMITLASHQEKSPDLLSHRIPGSMKTLAYGFPYLQSSYPLHNLGITAVTTAMTAMLKQLQSNPPPAHVKAVEEICVTCGGAYPYYKCLAIGGNTFPEFKDNIQEEDKCVEETYTDPDLAEYTFKVPPPPVQKPKPPIQRNFVLHTKDSPSPHISKLGDPGKFLIPCGFSELKCKALADLGASINLMPLSVWKKLGLPDLIQTRMTLELANRAICTPDGIARDVFIPVGKFTFSADFVVVDYKSDPRVPLILGRPFLRTARALIDVHGEEMILRDGDERLTLNMKHDTASYSNHPHRDSVNLINIFNLPIEDCLEDLVSNKQSGNPTFSLHKEIASPEVIHEFHDSKGCNFLSEEFPDIGSFNDIHPHFDDDPLSGSTTYSANSLLEEVTDELALITYPLDYDDNRTCDIESDLREIEFLLHQGEDFDFKDSIDQTDLANLDDLFVDPTPEIFIDEHPPDYSFLPRFDVYPDDFLEIESDADNFDDDSFDSKGEKIKESELLIDQLDLPCDIHLEYDSFNSQDFYRDDDLPSPDNEDKVFNPGILIHKKSVKIITRVAQEKKLAISFASLLFEDFDPPFYELLFFKEVPNFMRLLPFSSENEEKVFKPGIYTSKKVHSCFLPELSHPARMLIRGFPPLFLQQASSKRKRKQKGKKSLRSVKPVQHEAIPGRFPNEA
nr:reverse transcriptase domain-containing protein [Tanacetum cinerariifolium]